MNKQYSEEERGNFLSEWRASGLSGNKFCRIKNIRPTTFYNWTKKERQKQNIEESGIVNLPSLKIPTLEKNNIILEYRDWKITLPPGFNHNDALTAITLVETRNVS